MALDLGLLATINTSRNLLTITDNTSNWGVGSNINFTEVNYAEMYVGIKGVMYGPLILTTVFSAATQQSQLIFSVTPEILGLETDTFPDGIYEFNYGVDESSSPTVIGRDVWPGLSSYSFPLLNTLNKIPFTIVGDEARQYVLRANFDIPADDPGVNPRMTLNVNYQDGTTDTTETEIPKGSSSLIAALVDVDRRKEIKDVTGFLFNEDGNPTVARTGLITTISLTKQDLDIDSTVERALVSEHVKQDLNRMGIAFRKDFLCGKREFDKHEEFVMKLTAFRSVTLGSSRGLVDEAEEIIDFLSE